MRKYIFNKKKWWFRTFKNVIKEKQLEVDVLKDNIKKLVVELKSRDKEIIKTY